MLGIAFFFFFGMDSHPFISHTHQYTLGRTALNWQASSRGKLLKCALFRQGKWLEGGEQISRGVGGELGLSDGNAQLSRQLEAASATARRVAGDILVTRKRSDSCHLSLPDFFYNFSSSRLTAFHSCGVGVRRHHGWRWASLFGQFMSHQSRRRDRVPGPKREGGGSFACVQGADAYLQPWTRTPWTSIQRIYDESLCPRPSFPLSLSHTTHSPDYIETKLTMSWNNTPNPPPFPPHGPPQPGPFWNFINSPATGFGVDHTQNPEHGFAFGPAGFNAWSGRRDFGAGWGRRPPGRSHRGHRHGHEARSGYEEEADLYDITAAAAAAEAEIQDERDPEKAESPTTMPDADAEHPDPAEELPRPFSPNRRRGCRRGGFGGRGRGGPHGHSHHGPPFRGPPPFGANFDIPAMMEGFANHPFAQRLREYVEQIQRQMLQGNVDGRVPEDDGTFTPPIDVFDTSENWTIHVAIPGARKEDIGVNWDADRKTLVVSGVVHRPGDEAFIKTMVSSERKVGLFERKIQLPPVEANNDQVDGDHITAKMENGILIVVVPKAEKEWTEIKKVDIL